MVHAVKALKYEKFHRFIVTQAATARGEAKDRNGNGRGAGAAGAGIDDDLIAWALLGLGTVVNIGHALGTPNQRQRSLLYTRIANFLIQGNG